MRKWLVPVSRGENGTDVLLMGRGLLLLNMSVENGSESADFPFIHFLECTELLGEGNKALASMCLMLNTGDEVGNSFITRANLKTGKMLGVGEWFGGETFGSI